MAERIPVHGTDRVHAESRVRDPSFIMKGHHCHSCYELFYVEKGSCRFLIDEHIFDLHAGAFLLVPPMALHYTRYVFGPCRRTVILFRSEDLPEEVRDCLPQSSRLFSEATVFQVPEAARPAIAETLRKMVSEDQLRDGRTPLMLKIHLQSLLLQCSRVCQFLFDSPSDAHTGDSRILKAAQFICRYYMEPLTSEEVARAAGFSPNYLSRRFRSVTGIGLHEYLVFVRLQHAAQELVSTSDSITTIALRCGFSDSNYFKDSFKKKYGVTPRAYRKLP